MKHNQNNDKIKIAPPRDYFLESLKRNKRKKIIIIAGTITVLAGIIIACVCIGLSIKHSDYIERAKTIVVQEDIKSAFKDPEFADNSDWDKDGLSNKREKDLGTNVQNKDTDKDGIIDGDEVKLGTDPKKEDTDGDGLTDGDEIIAGLDPKNAKSNGIAADMERVVSIVKKNGEAEVTLKGNAKIADASVEELDLYAFNSNTSLVSKAYDVYCPHSFTSANITFTLDEDKINRYGIDRNDLCVLHFDSNTQKYTRLASSTNAEGTKITAKTDKLGTFAVGAAKTVNQPPKTRVFFLIDNSGSMYPKEKCADSTENDVDFKRVEFARDLVDKFSSKYEVAVAKYTGTYTKLCDFTSDKKTVANALESIKETDEFFNGTYSQTAISSCINEFEQPNGKKYKNVIVMLTDGESDETNPQTLEQLEKAAKEKNIVIMTVGLGADVDRVWLSELAMETGGKYYLAYAADALHDVYKRILTSMNYDMVHYNNEDDSIIGYSLYNTGFKPNYNGFSFKNFRTTTTSGVDYGMAVFARDWYMGNLQNSLGSLKPADESSRKVNVPAADISKTKAWKEYKTHTPLNSLTNDMLSGTFADVKEYLDYETGGDVLQLKDNLRDEAQTKGWSISSIPLNAKNLDWNMVELLSLDISGSMDKIRKANSPDDAELALMIYRLNALRWDDDKDEYSLASGESSFIRLENSLALGEPVVTTIDDKRTVNAISLIEDAANHRKYVLQVYDNSYPGQIKEIYIEKKPVCVLDKNNKVSGYDYVYTATYEGKQVGIAFSAVAAH